MVSAPAPTPTPVDEVVRTMATLPPEAQQEVLDFALFLQARIAAEDAKWDASFASTDSAKLRAWLDEERAGDQDLQPLFNDSGAPAV